jgi:hypothetical protein
MVAWGGRNSHVPGRAEELLGCGIHGLQPKLIIDEEQRTWQVGQQLCGADRCASCAAVGSIEKRGGAHWMGNPFTMLVS